MAGENYMQLGNYGVPGYGAPVASFDSQLFNGTDFSNQAATSASDYMANNLTAGIGGGASSGNWWEGWFGGKDANGIQTPNYAGTALGVAQGLGSAYMGMKQYGLAKQQLAMSKEQFSKNYEAQKTTTNASLEDRQRARVASNPGAYQSVGDYMNKNRIN